VCDVFRSAAVEPSWEVLALSSDRLNRAIDRFNTSVDDLLKRDRRVVPMLSRTVVVVHDEDHVREPLVGLLRTELRDLSAEVTDAACVMEGVGEVLRWKPQVVLVDYHLDENRTAVDLMREVSEKNFALGRGIRYLIVSGRADIETLAQIGKDLHADVRGMLTPTTEEQMRDLIARVRELLLG